MIEPNADAAETLALLLGLAGHKVEWASRGEAALDAARRQPPDVVLLEVRLPDTDGWRLAR